MTLLRSLPVVLLAVLISVSPLNQASGREGGPVADDALLAVEALDGHDCSSDQTAEAVCARAAGLLGTLLESGEYLAVAVGCGRLDDSDALPNDSLTVCAAAEARLGSDAEAASYLKKYVAVAPTAGPGCVAANLEAADILVASTRFVAAQPFLEAAAGCAASSGADDAVALRRRQFENCLNVRDAKCAARAADELGVEQGVFVVGMYLDRDMAAAAVGPARAMLADGVASLDELAVLAETFMAARQPAQLAAAAQACLAGCPGVDTLAVASVLARVGASGDAAAFAKRNIDRFTVPQDAPFEIAFLLLKAGETDKALDMFLNWSVGRGAGATGGDAVERQARVQKRLIGEGRFDAAVRFTVKVRGAGGQLSPAMAPDVVGAALKIDRMDDAAAFAGEGLRDEKECGPLRYRIALQFLDYDEHEGSAKLLEPCGVGQVSTSPDPLLPARVHLLRARLIRNGALKGDLDGEVKAAFDGAHGNADLVTLIDRFAASAGVGGEAAAVAVRAMATASPNDPEIQRRLAQSCIEAGDEPCAVAALEKFISLGQPDGSAVATATDMLLTAGRRSAALSLLDKERRFERMPPAQAYAVGNECLKAGDPECVARYIDIFLRGPVSDEVGYFVLADALLQGGFLELAERTVDVAAKAFPNDATGRGPLIKGRIALSRGDRAAADALFERAISGSSLRTLLILSVALEFSRLGELTGALKWFDKGIKDESASTRATLYHSWVDTLRRLGRANEISIDPLNGVAVNDFAEFSDTLSLLADSGRPDVALELARRLKNAVPASGLGPILLSIVQYQCQLHDAAGAMEAAEAVCAFNVTFSGDQCVRAAAMLRASGMTLDVKGLVGRINSGAYSQTSREGLPGLVLLTMLEYGIDDAFKVVEKADALGDEAVTALLDSSKQLRVMAGNERWQRMVGKLVAAGVIQDEWLRAMLLTDAAFGAGDRKQGRAAMDAALSSMRADRFMVMNLLLSQGEFELADKVFKSLTDKQLAELNANQLVVAYTMYVDRDRPDDAAAVLTRYVSVSKDKGLALQTTMAVALSSGDYRVGVQKGREIPDETMAPMFRGFQARTLWLAGQTEAALTQFRLLAPQVASEIDQPWASDVVKFLAVRAASSDELAGVLESVASGVAVMPSWFALTLASVEAARDGKANSPAGRARVFGILEGIRSVSAISDAEGRPDISDWVRAEALRGRAGSLAAAALERRGAAFAQTALYAACLDGDDATMRQAMARMCVPAAGKVDCVPTSGPDLLAVAGILHSCGRWKEAADHAMRFLAVEKSKLDDMSQAARIAVQSRAMSGGQNPLKNEAVDALTDDRIVRASLRVAVAEASGQTDVAIRGWDEAGALNQTSSRIALEAIRKRLDSGAPDAAGKAAEIVARLAFPGEIYAEVFKLFVESFRFGQAGEFLDLVKDTYRQPVEFGINRFKVQCESGDTAGAVATARDLARQAGDPTHIMTGLVESAARCGRLDLVTTLAKDLVRDGAALRLVPDAIEVSLYPIWFLDSALPESQIARDLLDTFHAAASDKELFCSKLTDGLVKDYIAADNSYPSNVARLFTDGRCGGRVSLRFDDLRRAISGPFFGLNSMASKPSITETMEMVRAATLTALLDGRVDDAIGWLQGALEMGGIPVDIVSVALEAGSLLLDRPELPAPEVSRFARFAIGLIDDVARGDDVYLLTRAQMLAAAGDFEEFSTVMQSRIDLDPTNPHYRNTVAYSLSVNRLARPTFDRDIKAAIALAGTSRPGYLETRAWGMHVYGDRKKALAAQKEASVLWNVPTMSVGLPECWNHLAVMYEAAGQRTDAIEAYRRSFQSSTGWDWHAIMSARRLKQLGFFRTEAESAR